MFLVADSIGSIMVYDLLSSSCPSLKQVCFIPTYALHPTFIPKGKNYSLNSKVECFRKVFLALPFSHKSVDGIAKAYFLP